jgi:hypothetical protein
LCRALPVSIISLAMKASTPFSIRSLTAVSALACALLLGAIAAGHAEAGVVGPSGQITGCYVKKGKAKGTLRVVPPGQRCRKGEKPLSWNAQGQSGSTGVQGGSGSSSQTDLSSLTIQLSQLQTRVTQLEGVLAGLTNTDLLGAVAAVADVNALCTQVPTVVTQLNSVRTVLSGLSLSGVIPLGLGLTVPSIPSALSPFSCP